MAEKEAGEKYKSGDFRDPYQQSKYREQSKSEYKDTKEAAHLVSGQITKAALNDHRSPGRPPKDEDSDVKELANAFGNLRMVKTETNRSEHTKIDNAIVKKADSGETLTLRQEDRARRQVEYLQENQDGLSKATYQAYKNLYGGLETTGLGCTEGQA